ncbi:MAG: hypothetical protein ACFWTX_10910 [Acidaminococcus timonensis]
MAFQGFLENLIHFQVQLAPFPGSTQFGIGKILDSGFPGSQLFSPGRSRFFNPLVDGTPSGKDRSFSQQFFISMIGFIIGCTILFLQGLQHLFDRSRLQLRILPELLAMPLHELLESVVIGLQFDESQKFLQVLLQVSANIGGLLEAGQFITQHRSRKSCRLQVIEQSFQPFPIPLQSLTDLLQDLLALETVIGLDFCKLRHLRSGKTVIPDIFQLFELAVDLKIALDQPDILHIGRRLSVDQDLFPVFCRCLMERSEEEAQFSISL